MDLGDPPLGSPHKLLKVGHHGSRNASEGVWLDAVAPEVAVICAGRRNPFGHPHPETFEALRSRSIPLFVSGPARGVRVLAEFGGWTVETGSGERLRIPGRTLPR